MKVKDVMHRAIVTEGNISLRDAAKIMSERHIGCLIIIKKDKIAGIVTERDILRNLNKLGSKLSKIMSTNVVTIDEDESLDNAAILMDRYRIKRLPVIKNNRLVGIITVTDLIAHSEELGEVFFFE